MPYLFRKFQAIFVQKNFIFRSPIGLNPPVQAVASPGPGWAKEESARIFKTKYYQKRFSLKFSSFSHRISVISKLKRSSLNFPLFSNRISVISKKRSSNSRFSEYFQICPNNFRISEFFSIGGQFLPCPSTLTPSPTPMFTAFLHDVQHLKE